MGEKHVLILERSSQNLHKVSEKGKTVLEGVFAEFGIENRNGRIYEEKEYLPHLEYLKKDIANGALLGELDHPERFEVALSNVSHRITELWYDQAARQIKGRIEVLDGTPRGQVAKALLEAGVPLSISSRAAGTVNEDKTVQIQQIYTYDLVAKPGFESAQLHSVNEQAQSKIMNLVTKLNESYKFHEKENIASKLGIMNENVSIIDLSSKYPTLKLREEAKQLNVKNKNGESKMENNQVSEDLIQRWTLAFKNELSNITSRLEAIEGSILEGKGGATSSKEIATIKKYLNELRKIQEDSLNWQTEIAKGLNKVARHSHMVAEKSNQHYSLTKKIVETVDHNAKTLNATQDWTTRIAETTNAIGETVDYNAKMLNGMNEWVTEVAKAVNMLNEWSEEKAKAINKLHEWGTEKAVAINEFHEWISSIAKNLNRTVNYTEDMIGRALSKEDAKKIIEYVELVSEQKADPKLKEAINEMLKTHSIYSKPLNELSLKGIETLDADNPKTKAHKVSPVGDSKAKTAVDVDPKTKAIVAKIRNMKVSKTGVPKGLNTNLSAKGETPGKVTNALKPNQKGLIILDLTKTIPTPKPGDKGMVSQASQKLKLDVKPEGKLKEELTNRAAATRERSQGLEGKLAKLISTLEKEKSVDEEIKQKYPFTSLLSEDDRKRFLALSETDKTKVVNEVAKVPTVESEVILKLWENALTNSYYNGEPLWLKAAPKKFRVLYDKSSDILKESLKAKSEFFNLSTQYQINNFWETSGLEETPVPLNEEIVVAKGKSDKQPEEKEYDNVVASVALGMKRYQF